MDDLWGQYSIWVLKLCQKRNRDLGGDIYMDGIKNVRVFFSLGTGTLKRVVRCFYLKQTKKKNKGTGTPFVFFFFFPIKNWVHSQHLLPDKKWKVGLR